MVQNHKIILGSASPRRKELLKGLDLDFEVDSRSDFDEVCPPGTPAEEVPMLFARGKSEHFHRPLEKDEILITADTVVILDGRALGKPHSRDEAVSMLRALSGRKHEVRTAVCLRSLDKFRIFSVGSTVCFDELSEEEISYYIDKYKPYDKAGAYGIQEWIGYVGISGIEGSYFNVMGLPVQRLWKELRTF